MKKTIRQNSSTVDPQATRHRRERDDARFCRWPYEGIRASNIKQEKLGFETVGSSFNTSPAQCAVSVSSQQAHPCHNRSFNSPPSLDTLVYSRPFEPEIRGGDLAVRSGLRRSGSPPKSDAGPGRSGIVVLTVVTWGYPARRAVRLDVLLHRNGELRSPTPAPPPPPCLLLVANLFLLAKWHRCSVRDSKHLPSPRRKD